jgi:hypothetical protein
MHSLARLEIVLHMFLSCFSLCLQARELNEKREQMGHSLNGEKSPILKEKRTGEQIYT